MAGGDHSVPAALFLKHRIGGHWLDKICLCHRKSEQLRRTCIWLVYSYTDFFRLLRSLCSIRFFDLGWKPTVWAFDMMVQMYGALFLMAGAYALAQDSHVRGDFLYRLFPVRMQAFLDFLLYILFFFPGMIALVWYGAEISGDSWRYKEVSWNSPARIQIYFFKTLIPLAGGLLILQGLAELVRAWKAMRTGVWMERLDDVRETEDALISETPQTRPVSV